MGWTAVHTWLAAVLTTALMNEQVRDNIEFLKENIALEAPVELTIDGAGAVTKTKSYHTIDTDGDAADDELITINGGNDGDIIFIQAEDDAHTVIIKNLGGNIHCGVDIHLADTHDIIMLMYDAAIAEWHVIGAYSHLRTFLVNTFECPDPAQDWAPQIDGCHLGASKTDEKFWIALNFFKVGDQLISYRVVGDATQTNALTLDAKAVRISKADPILTEDIAGGAIAQISGDGLFDVEKALTAPEVVATDRQYVIEFSGLTGVADTITVMGVEVDCIRVL